MLDPGKLLARVRELGGNVMLDVNRLRIINRHKLPPEALLAIKTNAGLLAKFLEQEGEVEERAAIIEHDGGMPRNVADDLTRLLFANPPQDVPLPDWTWFVSKASEVLDRRAA